MKVKGIVLASLLFALAMTLKTALSALACVPSDDVPPRCLKLPPRQPTVRPVSGSKSIATAKPTPTPTPGGDTPEKAMEASDAWLTLAPGATAWYKISQSFPKQRIEVWLDANGQGGMTFDVYSPEQMTNMWPSGTPKGRGAPSKGYPHDLVWSGLSTAGGVWYAMVTNTNFFATKYKLGSSASAAGQRNCTGPYWEWIGSSYVQWPGFCK